jgi:hypothetical protein
MSTTSTNIQTAVRAYRDLGLNVLPVRKGTKRPAVPWEQWQESRVPEDRLGPLFYRQVGVCVVLGPVSGGLGCRDFDAEGAYQTWADGHGDLATFLPTARTARGHHVYFKTNGSGIHVLGDGELRLSRGIMLLPPTVHPSGTRYQWTIPPTSDNLVHIDDLVGAGLANSDSESPEHVIHQVQEGIGSRGGVGVRGNGEGASPTDGVGIWGPDVERVIRTTLPTKPGTRHRLVFDLARALKSMAEFADAEPCDLVHIVTEWHRRALPVIRTKDPMETVADFITAWRHVRSAIGMEPLPVVFQRAVQSDPPAKAVRMYPGHRELHLLATFCREMQKSVGNRPFFLSCETAGSLIGKPSMTAHRWLMLLVEFKLLKVVRKGDRGKGAKRATTYRWIGGE